MEKNVRIIFIAGLSALYVLFNYQEAQAYVDPSAGSYFMQLLLSGLLSGILVIKIFWKNLRGQLNRIMHKERGNRPA